MSEQNNCHNLNQTHGSERLIQVAKKIGFDNDELKELRSVYGFAMDVAIDPPVSDISFMIIGSDAA